jgi:transcriptional regulator with XRE-family HTH domain
MPRSAEPGSATATLPARPLGTVKTMAEDNRIGQFLRARRERVRPEDVGLPDLGRRRVPGLRREELATLAGVSADYYVRLEQGRERHPSEQVIDALARALQLTKTPPRTCTSWRAPRRGGAGPRGARSG